MASYYDACTLLSTWNRVPDHSRNFILKITALHVNKHTMRNWSNEESMSSEHASSLRFPRQCTRCLWAHPPRSLSSLPGGGPSFLDARALSKRYADLNYSSCWVGVNAYIVRSINIYGSVTSTPKQPNILFHVQSIASEKKRDTKISEERLAASMMHRYLAL